MKFSERLGYKSVKEQLQIESIDIDLKNSLWTVFLDSFFDNLSNYGFPQYQLFNYHHALWFNFFKLPIDKSFINSDRSVSKDGLKKFLRNFFFDSKNWYDPFDLVEFTAKFAGFKFVDDINLVLEREKSAYRFVNGQITQITSAIEISEIEDAITSNDIYKTFTIHLNTALSLLADKQNPDYRNSIKESISAVESMCKIFSGNDKATLGETLNILEKKEKMHPAMKKAFSS